jgi:hypothetical protein
VVVAAARSAPRSEPAKSQDFRKHTVRTADRRVWTKNGELPL